MSPSSNMNCVAVITYDSRCRGNWSRMIFLTDQQFLIQITSAPPKAKIASGPARLHVQDQRFCITVGVPPRLIGFWEIGQLRWVSAAGVSGPCGALESTGQHMSLEVSEMEWKCEPIGNVIYGVSFVCGLWTYFSKNLLNSGYLENILELFLLD